MFESMTIKDGRTYEAMVLGLLKVLEQRNDPAHSPAQLFSIHIQLAVQGDFEMLWYGRQMGESTGTFNSLVRIAVVSSGDKTGTELALGLIRDMVAIGMVNINLSSHYSILRAIIGDFQSVITSRVYPYWDEKKALKLKSREERKSSKSVANPAVLDMVITHLESLPKLPPLEDPEDAFFFRSAMSAALLCADANTGLRTYNLVEKQSNSSFLGEKRAPFYSTFLMTLATADVPFPLLYHYYNEIVPERLRPKSHVYHTLFNAVIGTNTPDPGIISKLYEDMRRHGVELTRPLARTLFTALASAEKPEDLKANLEIMLDVLHWIKVFNLAFSPISITQVIRVYCLNEKLQDAWNFLETYEKINCHPSFSALLHVLLLAANHMDQYKVVKLFEMLAKYGYSMNEKRRIGFYHTACLSLSDRRHVDDLFKTCVFSTNNAKSMKGLILNLNITRQQRGWIPSRAMVHGTLQGCHEDNQRTRDAQRTRTTVKKKTWKAETHINFIFQMVIYRGIALLELFASFPGFRAVFSITIMKRKPNYSQSQFLQTNHKSKKSKSSSKSRPKLKKTSPHFFMI
ncbi:Pentatricopeptide repeat [Desmophyllum pertusum]|uniref:Pentatricopeptide repeat n=1 Tax=Desmophyllum pertusum TaxID=174260 RepID=A0A9X0A356_9CNID|nr:Pentatricopeptide repeat [Desmophyllum pertusum]